MLLAIFTLLGTLSLQIANTEVLTADIIATHYGADVQVLTDPTGGIIVAPRRSPRRSP